MKLDYADGTVAMDWSKITRVESPQNFVVANKAGTRLTGSLQQVARNEIEKGTEEPTVQVTGTSSSEVLSTKEVVEMRRTDTSFWQNLHGGMNAGFNFAKQQSRTQYNFQAKRFSSELSGRPRQSISRALAVAAVFQIFATM